MDTRPHIGKIIRSRRVAQAMTRAALSRSSGLSQPYLYRVETGSRTPSDVALVKLSRALGCNPEDLTRPASHRNAASA